MNEKTYKTRVEISLIVEIDADAICEDNAGAIAEDIAGDLATEMVSTAEYGGHYVANWGVRCVDVKEDDE